MGHGVLRIHLNCLFQRLLGLWEAPLAEIDPPQVHVRELESGIDVHSFLEVRDAFHLILLCESLQAFLIFLASLGRHIRRTNQSLVARSCGSLTLCPYQIDLQGLHGDK